MMAEQAMSEQPNSPIRLQTLNVEYAEALRKVIRARQRRLEEQQLRLNHELDRRASESAFMDLYERGFPTL